MNLTGLENGSDLVPRPNRTIFVLVFVLPIITVVAYGGTDQWAFLFLAPLTALLGLVWAVRTWRSGTFEIGLHVSQFPLILLFALGLLQLLPLVGSPVPEGLLGIPVSTALSMDPFATRQFLVRLAGYIIFFAACLTFVDTYERFRTAVMILIAFGGTIAFVGILQKLASPDAIYGVRRHAQAIPFGPYINQHHFASLMVLLSGVAVAHLLGNGVSRQSKFFFAIATAIMGIAVPLTGSRGGIISYVAMLGIASLAALYRGRGERKFLAQAPVFLVAVGLIVIIFGTVIFLGGGESLLRGIGFANTADDVSSGRLHFWTVALQIFAANPIIGAGLDAFGVAYTRYDTNGGLFRVEQAHNEYLQMLAEGGVLGFACLLAFVFLLLKGAFRSIAGAVDDFQRVSVIGILAGCVGIFVHSFFDFPLRTAGNAYFFLLAASLAIVSIPKTVLSERER